MITLLRGDSCKAREGGPGQQWECRRTGMEIEGGKEWNSNKKAVVFFSAEGIMDAIFL